MSKPQSPIRLLLLTSLFVSVFSIAPARAQADKKAKAEDDRAPITGEILEKIDASSYSYLRLKTPKYKDGVWVAVPQIDIKLHKTVTVGRPIPMFGFESKVLKRKFDRIFFGVLAEQKDEIAASSRGHWIPGMSKKPEPTPAGHPKATDDKSVDLTKIKVKKAEGENAVTISELFTKKADLKSKTVTIRGQVIKYNSGILGKNWVHIADGSGSIKDKTFEVTVITLDEAKMGDTILVTGKVALDKKLDPYFFPIALEDAKIKKN